jgi:hypothetical protein
MTTLRVDRLDLAVLDGHALDDTTLSRLVPECRSLTAFTTGGDNGDLASRWAALAPETEFIDGGHVADLRAALTECGRRAIVVLATGVPKDAARFVAQALQGAAAMTEFGVPGVAVHVMRPEARSGSVAWLTDTGSLSGYGVLFAVGYAHLHGTGVDLIEPTGGLDRPRTGEAMDDALAFAETSGVPITRHTDPSPFSRVIRDEHCLVVHPVLDAPKGFNLLHPGELSHKAVASGNPAVVVDLLEQFPGDVVAVFDGVHLLSGSIPAARIAAGVALGVVAAAGIGTVVASPAVAASITQQAPAGVTVTASGHNGMAHPGNFHVVNSLDHAVSMSLTATWVSSGNHPALHTTVDGVVVQPGESLNVSIPRPTGVGQGSYHIGSTAGVVTHHFDVVVTTGPQTQGGGTVATPEKAPDPVVITGTVGPTITEKSPVVMPQAVPGVVSEGHSMVPTLGQVPEPMQVPPLQPVVVTPPLVPQAIPTVTPVVETPMVVTVLQPVVTPPLVPQAIPTVTPVVETPMVVTVLQPVVTPVVETPMVVPPLVPQVTPVVETPMVVPPQVPQVPQQVPQPNVPKPMVQPQVQPMLQPPLHGTTNEIVTESVPTVVTGGVVTPDVPVEVGGSVVTPATTTDAPSTQLTTTETPGTVPGSGGVQTVTTPVSVGQPQTVPHQTATHHASNPGQVTTTAVDGDHAPSGELAHTGGSTAILAIVAGSLIAAGAGIAVAGHLGKDEPDSTVPDA